jgi:hypothetical protein
VTVIDSVLKIRNAPTNSATAAISAVDRPEVGGGRRGASAQVARRRQDVRLGGQRDLERRATSAGVAPRRR